MIENQQSATQLEGLKTVSNVLDEAEKTLRELGEEGGEKARQLRAQLIERLQSAKIRIADAEETLKGKAKDAAKVTDEYVHDNPWKAVGAASGIAFLLGMLLSRR